ncbi:MAG: 3-oxo-tetronate kinase [Pseudomonadota bacterium]
MTLCIGAIADDFTGATDLAVTLQKGGMRVLQLFGVPTRDVALDDIDAVVIALKSRTAPVAEAVGQSLTSCDWLKARGAEQVFFKYCSTFDSTDKGNIGPVADALLDRLGARSAVVCPAFPRNGRTVYMGHLFVGDRLLSASSMKDHPLTPMRESDLVALLGRQSRHAVGLVPLETVRRGGAATLGAIDRLAAAGTPYAVVDATDESDLLALGEAVRGAALVTGGSGAALGLPKNFGLSPNAAPARTPDVKGRGLVLAGSCSAATRAQIAAVSGVWPSRKLDIGALADGADVAADLSAWALAQNADAPVMIYASADPEEVAANQSAHGVEAAGEMIERTMGALAQRLAAAGFHRIVVAGGETSGAVVSALGIDALRIRAEIAPGVPWTESQGAAPLALVLKSGNFGGPRFFAEAFEALP